MSNIIKKLILLVLIATMFAGCKRREIIPITKQLEYKSYIVVEIDSCEYIAVDAINTNYVTAHKGNCKYCAERRKQELKKLVEQLEKK